MALLTYPWVVAPAEVAHAASCLAFGLLKVQERGGGSGVLSKKVWRRLLAVDADTVIEWVEFEEDADAVVVSVRPRVGGRLSCGRCGRPSAGYDRGEGRGRWRTPWILAASAASSRPGRPGWCATSAG